MDVRGSMSALFHRRRVAKAPELSRYSVKHDVIDEFIRDDLRRDAPVFDQALDRVPEIEVEDHDSDGNVIGTRSERVEAARDLWSDSFFAFFDRHDVPTVKGAGEVRPSHEIMRQVMGAMVEHEDFKVARSRTRDDQIGSAFATLKAQEALEEQLQTTLKEHMQRANEMERQEDAMGDLEGQLKDLRGQASEAHEAGAQPPDWLKQQIKDTAAKKAEARAQLEQAAVEQAVGLNMAAMSAVDEVAQAGREAAECWASLPGNGVGQESHLPPDRALDLAMRWQASDVTRKVAEMLGRLERDFRFKRSNRTVSGREIPVDVELGDDLAAVLPSELMALGVPELRGLFYKKYADRTLLQYEMVGEAESGKGPLILVIDFSSSMKDSEKHIGAKAVSLALLTIAHRERRPVHIIAANTQVLGEWEFRRGKIDLEDALAFATLAPTGGTRLFSAVARAAEIMERSPDFRQADVVIVTDGESRYGEPDLLLRDRLRDKGVRLHGISIAAGITKYLATMCDPVIPVADFNQPNEATDHIVQTVI